MTIDWNRYADRAQELRAAAEALWWQNAPHQPAFDDHTRWSTYCLRTTFLINYDAILTLVRDPSVAYAGEPLLRGALEAWAHLYWIESGEPRSNRTGRRLASKRKSNHCLSDNHRKWSTPETRALCWRMSDATSYHRSVSSAQSILKEPKATHRARHERDRLKKLHSLSGCPGKGRDYRDVAPTLALISRKLRFPWVLVLWDLYSGSTHQGVPLRLIGPPTRSAWDGVLPEWERRALLVRTVTVFLMAYQHVINLSTDGDVACLAEFVDRIATRSAVPLTDDLNALPL
jgi:hypothetical protein